MPRSNATTCRSRDHASAREAAKSAAGSRALAFLDRVAHERAARTAHADLAELVEAVTASCAVPRR